MNLHTLQYWHKLEHFYPYILSNHHSENAQSYAVTNERTFPDFKCPHIPNNKVVAYYKVYLGLFSVEGALAALDGAFGIEGSFRDVEGDESCFCMFELSAEGAFMPRSFKISSFPWAIHRIREGQIVIDQWDNDFKAFEMALFDYLVIHNGALTYDLLLAAREQFADFLNWQLKFSDCWLKIDRIQADLPEIKQNTPPVSQEDSTSTMVELEIDLELAKHNQLLNSFYIRDLETIIAGYDQTDANSALSHYITHNSHDKIEIEKDIATQFKLFNPKNLPYGRWPSTYGMRFMQQMDVNAFMCKEGRHPLFSVNGPPGTGKTTLLKDIVAAILVERAIALTALSTPNAAFGKVVGKITYKDFTNNVRDILPEFKKYGMLVASNNNGAVENITNELPSLKELPEQYQLEEYYYLAQISDLIFGEGKTWALIAASLGNKKKREAFVKKFWPIEKETQGEQNPANKSTRLLYNFNKDLTQKVKQSSKAEWDEAKKRFKDLLAEVQEAYAKLDTIYNSTGILLENLKKQAALRQQLTRIDDQIAQLDHQLSECAQAVHQLFRQQEILNQQLNALAQNDKLLWLKKALFKKSANASKYAAASQELAQVTIKLTQMQQESVKLDTQIKQKIAERDAASQALQTMNSVQHDLEKQLTHFQHQNQMPLRFDYYFTRQSDNEAQKSSPYGYHSLNVLRERLFLEALKLQEAFVYNSTYLRGNLDALGKMLRGSIPADKLSEVAPALIQSLFLVVPVVSTTFASVGSFLRYIPKDEIAYLFIDEAGQAVPQAAAGAIWRAKRVIAVGDPLQIEPVVTLHECVVHALAQYYNQSTLAADKYVSIQSFADQANRYGAYRIASSGTPLWVGAPLNVHNRCQRTVFNIANQIAYNNKMIYATLDNPSAVCTWIDVGGTSTKGHFVMAQAQAITPIVTDIFRAAFDKQSENKMPSLFLISPFRSVRSSMAAYFRTELTQMVQQNQLAYTNKECKEWVRTSIGTIHTFQGKQADTVILCLGIGSDGRHNGALNWASERANILNVAITRAKVNLYIVGDKALWGEQPFFETALKFCTLYNQTL